MRYPESIAIFDDEFTNGKSISKVPIGNMLLYTTENMVLEVRQLSLTPAAYDYYEVYDNTIIFFKSIVINFSKYYSEGVLRRFKGFSKVKFLAGIKQLAMNLVSW